MKILWLSHLIPYPPAGGVRQRSFGLLRELSRRFDVTFAGFNQTDLSKADEIADASAALNKFCNVAFTEPIPSDLSKGGKQWLAARSLATRHPYTVNWLSSPCFRERLRSTVATLQPDLVHLDTISLVPYRYDLPAVVSTLNHHNVESHMLWRRAEKETSRLKRAYFRQEARRLQRYEARVAGDFGVHLVCSELDGERLRLIAPEVRIEVTPNGVDIDYFRPTVPAPPRVPKSLIFVGGLSWYPNLSAVEFLVREVWPLISEDGASLTIVGKSPPDWLRALSERDRRIRVLGWVDDVRPLMERSAAYVCPIFDGGGTKLKVLDALAMGVPLVANPIACEGIDVEAERHVLLASTAEDFVRCVRRVWDGSPIARSLSANSVRFIHDKYSFERIGKRLGDLYAEIAETGSPGEAGSN